MEALPWYRSPVYVSLVTALVTQLVSLLGRADAFPTQMINDWVNWGFQMITFVALIYGEIKRRTSEVSPIVATKAQAEVKNTQELQP